MRIVAGRYGGRRLQVPGGRDIRPTSDKVRGAIFNTLGGYLDLQDAYVLDVFCGTGALGLEALSRGAEFCGFVDKAKPSLCLTKDNAEMLGVVGACDFTQGDSTKIALKYNKGIDLVFLDPPYGQGLVERALENIAGQDVLRDDALVVVESEKDLSLNVLVDFELLKDKVYGDTLVTYLRYNKSVP